MNSEKKKNLYISICCPREWVVWVWGKGSLIDWRGIDFSLVPFKKSDLSR